jgi:hypothetical protein
MIHKDMDPAGCLVVALLLVTAALIGWALGWGTCQAVASVVSR